MVLKVRARPNDLVTAGPRQQLRTNNWVVERGICGSFHLQLYFFRQPLVIIVQKGDPASSRRLHGKIARLPRANAAFERDHFEALSRTLPSASWVAASGPSTTTMTSRSV